MVNPKICQILDSVKYLAAPRCGPRHLQAGPLEAPEKPEQRSPLPIGQLQEAVAHAGGFSRVQPDGFVDGGSAAVVQERRLEPRSGEHTSELQSPCNIVCRLL